MRQRSIMTSCSYLLQILTLKQLVQSINLIQQPRTYLNLISKVPQLFILSKINLSYIKIEQLYCDQLAQLNNKIQMSGELQEDLVFSNLLTLNFTYIEQRLRKNFEIIASRMSKLEGLLTLDDRVRTLEKEAKFVSMKIDSIVLRLPENGGNLSEDDVKNICNERIGDYMATDNLKTNKLFQELKIQLEKSLGEKPRKELREPKRMLDDSITKKDATSPQAGKSEVKEGVISVSNVSRQVLKKHLNMDEMMIVDKLLKEQKSSDQLLVETAAKLERLDRQFEEARMAKGVLSIVQRDIDKFEKYETYEQRYARQEQKAKGSGKDTAKEIGRERDGKQSELKTTIQREPDNAIFTPNRTLIDSRGLAVSRRGGAAGNDDTLNKAEDQQVDPEKQRISKRNKSLSKLMMPEKVQRRLRFEDTKDLAPIIREIEVRLENKVSKEVFTNLMQDLEDRLQALRHSRQINDTYEIKRYCNSVENRLQAVISFIQQAQQDEDPLVAKKKWSCMSCDKQAEKYGAKVGPHLNWETLNTKRLSPTKAGAFGQTVLFANKVKNLIDQRKGAEVPEGE